MTASTLRSSKTEPDTLNQPELEQLIGIINRRRVLKRGDYLFRSGAELHSLYVVRTGFFKACMLHDDGREQVTGFYMAGELLGMDAIDTGSHSSDAIALEDSVV